MKESLPMAVDYCHIMKVAKEASENPVRFTRDVVGGLNLTKLVRDLHTFNWYDEAMAISMCWANLRLLVANHYEQMCTKAIEKGIVINLEDYIL
jgi:hypothetical protein